MFLVWEGTFEMNLRNLDWITEQSDCGESGAGTSLQPYLVVN